MKKILLSLAFAMFGLAANSFAQAPVTSQDFSGTATPGMPTGWTNTHTGAGNGWVTTTAATNLYFGTIPNTGLHSEYAVVDEYNTPGNNPAYMTSPTFSLSGVTTPYLTYDYTYYAAYASASPYTHEAAWIEISDNATAGTPTWTLVDSIPAFTASGETWQTMGIDLSGHTSATTAIRFCYTDHGASLIGLAVDQISVFSAVASDIAITGVAPTTGTPSDYFLVGNNATFTGTVLNHGTSAISSFSVSYSVDGGTPVTNTVTAAIPAFTSYNFTDATPYTVATAGLHNVQVWVTCPGETYLVNDTMNTTVSGVTFMPTKKLMIEEATGTWCGWCVRGIVFMDSLRTLYGHGVSLVAVHNSDPMTVTAYDAWMGGLISGYPSVVIDRYIVDDPQNLLDLYTQHSGDFGFADIAVAPNLVGSTLTASVTVTPAVDMTSGDYRLSIVLTEDDVHGVGSTWDQHDYYSYTSNNIALTGGGVNYQDSLNPISGASMYYQHVNRSIAPAVTGGTGLIPGSMTAGTPYSYTMTTPVTTGWNTNKMHGIVMLIDGTTGAVLNSQNFEFVPPLAIGNTVPVCVGVTKLLTEGSTGGAWSSDNAAVATINPATGAITGVSLGTATISFQTSEGIATSIVTVNAQPADISGSAVICNATVTLSDATAGGTWSSSNATIASVSASGVVTGLHLGSATISYTSPSGCFTTTSAVVNCVEEVSPLANTISNVRVYPNPSTGTFVVELPATTNGATIAIYDLLGNTVDTRTVSTTAASKESFNMESLSAGNYFVKVTIGDNVFHDKLVIIKN